MEIKTCHRIRRNGRADVLLVTSFQTDIINITIPIDLNNNDYLDVLEKERNGKIIIETVNADLVANPDANIPVEP